MDIRWIESPFRLYLDAPRLVSFSSPMSFGFAITHTYNLVIDLLNDFNTTTLTPDIRDIYPPIGSRIMEVIHAAWLAIHGEVIAEIQRLSAQFPEYSLELTGHSLGSPS